MNVQRVVAFVIDDEKVHRLQWLGRLEQENALEDVLVGFLADQFLGVSTIVYFIGEDDAGVLNENLSLSIVLGLGELLLHICRCHRSRYVQPDLSKGRIPE